MTRISLMGLMAVMLAGCGVQRPLMKPKDIPAFEEQLHKKREKLEQEQRELEQENQPEESAK